MIVDNSEAIEDGEREERKDKAEDEDRAKKKALAVGVSFDPGQPVMYFRRGNLQVVPGDRVVAQLDRAVDLGQVACLVHLPAEQVAAMPPLLRVANQSDLRRREEQNAHRQESLAMCAEKIAEHNLPMRLIDCYYTLDGHRLVFYFAAEGRVDFRALVRDLARIFRCRIELRQVGVRDHAKLIGGIGPCGRPLCCAQFLHSFEPVSIKVAKDQGLALNPAKLSGLCDRLMCCLLYEHETYRGLLTEMPKAGQTVTTPRGPGQVLSASPLTGQVTVALENGTTAAFRLYDLGEAAEREKALEGLGPQSSSQGEPQPQWDTSSPRGRSDRGRGKGRGAKPERQPDGAQEPFARSAQEAPKQPQASEGREQEGKKGRGRNRRPRWRRRSSNKKQGEQ